MGSFIFCLGCLTAVYLTFQLLKLTFILSRRIIFTSTLDVKSLGEWALVTGSTDGIGKAFANALAKRGVNIILVSRNLEKLQNVAKEIQYEHKVETKTIVIDFSDSPEQYIKNLRKEIELMDIGIAVNNVGCNEEYPMEFLELKREDVQKLVNINLVSMTEVTKIILPQMVKKKKGLMINIGSLASEILMPLMLVYSSTKSFVAKFSKCLAQECVRTGVVVHCFTPGYVDTNLTRLTTNAWLPPEAYVESAMKRLGTERFTTGHYFHDTLKYLGSLFPERIIYKLAMKEVMEIRAKHFQETEQ